MSEFDLLTELLERMRNRGSYPCLEDDQIVLSGIEATGAVLAHAEVLGRITSQRGYVLLALPNSAGLAVLTLACLVADRVPIVCNPWVRTWQGFVDDDLPIELAIYSGAERTELGLGFEAVRICLESLSYLSTHAGIPENSSGWRKQNECADFCVPVARENRSASDIAIVVYTSGSSGQPKPVGIVFRSLEYLCFELKAELGLTAETRAVIAMPMFHTLAVNTQFFPTLYAGGSCVFLAPELEMGSLMRRLMAVNGTYVALVAEVVQQLNREQNEHDLDFASSVQQVVLAGGQINRHHLMQTRTLFPRAVIHRGYGLTEAIRVTMANSNDPHFENLANGRPLRGQELRILGECGEELPQGQAGTIFVKGPNTGNELFGHGIGPSLAAGFLCTGDIGFINAFGGLEVLGRTDRVFKSQGRKVAPAEIEHSVTHLSEVSRAVCVPAPCVRKGLRPVLVIEVGRRLDFAAAERLAGFFQFLGSSLRGKLEPYKVPREVFLLSEMPMLPSLKPNVSALIGMFNSMKISDRQPQWVAAGIRFYTAPLIKETE
jgi:acyl-CoA synthetase (AMP-forming)/AMP-acid ligase II